MNKKMGQRLMRVVMIAAVMMLFGDHMVLAEEINISFFESKIRPVLVRECYECHSAGAEKVQGGLLLDSRAGLLKGGDSGPAISLTKPKESLLLKALRYEATEMPPKGQLADALIADFARWIEAGAPDPRLASVAREESPPEPTGEVHWAFQRPTASEPPSVENAAWPANDIDRFILHNLEAAGVKPASPATKTELLRRVYFDLIGLPPEPAAIDRFLADDSPQAFASVVDELLESPHFGERWGRHWLDVARYADSIGGGGNVVFDNAWRYRDWVIRSFNEDKPYDRFLLEQIAGDLLKADDAKQRSKQIIATGFLALGRRELPEYDKQKLNMDVVDEQIDTVGKAVLGLTLGCARCHDHKFDPVSQRDYYALAGIFESTVVNQPPKGGPLSTWLLVSLPDKSGKALAVRDAKKPVDTKICIRGDVHLRGEQTPRGVPTALTDSAVAMPSDQSGRLELAQWIASSQNPLTARVMVNRVWHWVFGRGLVSTPDNFGLRGSEPSHPELLDWLAVQLAEDQWSLKKTIRRIVLSRTYQLSTRPSEHAQQIDPQNQLYSWRTRRRLEAEIIRDAMLAVSGGLDETPFGKTLTFTGRLEGKLKPVKADPWRRRSVFLPRYRGDKQLDIMQVFDAAHPALVTGHRIETSAPTQALYLMNSPFLRDQSKQLASRIVKKEFATEHDRLQFLYRLTIGRPASEAEAKADLAFLDAFRLAATKLNPDEPTPTGESDRRAWIGLCHTLLASNEFLFVE